MISKTKWSVCARNCWVDPGRVTAMKMKMRLWSCLMMLAALTAPACAAAAQDAPDTPDARRQAAERLFDIPVYRELATRQLYQSLRSLPEQQYLGAVEALKQPRVVGALREVVVRSMAQTYTLRELAFLARVLSAEEARILVDKTDAFEAVLTRELLSAALADPDLSGILLPR
jgi:hypothetical protein